MISEISMGKSFFHCISYCLEDKRDLTEEQKIRLSAKEGLQHKDRAEVLAYNNCFGDKHELTEQFNDVRRLSKRVEKPVLHLTMRLGPGEVLQRSQLIDIATAMVKEMGVADNQYVVIQHRDTNEQHIHVVANRVGYEGKAASSSNNFYKMDKLCRRLEKEYHLQQVLSPKSFLSAKQRLIPRHDRRKEKMTNDIRQSLQKAKTYEDFSQKMQSLGYKIIKGRGITFIDEKKMTVKGSELGFSLGKIESILKLKSELTIRNTLEKITPAENQSNLKLHPKQSPLAEQNGFPFQVNETGAEHAMIQSPLSELSKLLGDVLKVEQLQEGVNTELIREAKKLKQKRKKRLGL